MELKLDFNINSNELNLTHKDQIVSIGSCFSEEISAKLSNAGFHIEGNTFGTLFHPEAISNVIKSSINQSDSVSILKRDDLYFSWDSSSAIYGYSETELVDRIKAQRALFRSKLSNAGLLIITLGTSWGYRLKENDCLVGNCHKMNTNLFKKELQSLSEMKLQWRKLIEDIKKFNPALKILFTVSPVRHKKNGLIENNKSKARLIELVHSLVEEHDCSQYFPAYEIMIDELRDYRFYSNDLVHPNEIAVDYIWEAFKRASISKESCELISRIKQIKSSLNHKSLHPDSNQNIVRIKTLQAEQKELILKHPEINWE